MVRILLCLNSLVGSLLECWLMTRITREKALAIAVEYCEENRIPLAEEPALVYGIRYFTFFNDLASHDVRRIRICRRTGAIVDDSFGGRPGRPNRG